MTMQPILSACTIKNLNLWLDTDIGDDLIEQACVNVQRTLIKDTLGYPYWDSIYNQFIANSGSSQMYLAADQYIMDNFINDIISYGVAFELVSELYIQLKSAGPRTITSTQSLIAPEKMISFDQQRYQNKINERRVAMVKYMEANRNSYTLYFKPTPYNDKVVTSFPINRCGTQRRGRRY